MIKREQFVLAMRNIPAWTVVIFTASSIIMNLLANKSIDIDSRYLALDCGIFVSWIAFFSMDVVAKRYGAKAAISVSLTAAMVNVAVACVFFLTSFVPGTWGMSYELADAATANAAVNGTFKGNWFILFGSTVALIVSAIVNALSNVAIGKMFKKQDTFLEYITRSYISTFVGQFVDNLTFALIVSISLFGWTVPQSIGCAVVGAVVELIGEIIFSPLGYKVTRKWKALGVGQEYLDRYEGAL